MPMFDYRCPTCGTSEERLVAHSEVEVECVRCERGMERQFPTSFAIGSSSDVPRGTLSGGDWGAYDRTDLHASATYATEASYDILRESGMGADRAKAAAKEAGPGMIKAGEALIANQEAAGQR